MPPQLSLFGDLTVLPKDQKSGRAGTFLDNVSLPLHGWFRYSAGFSAEWVAQTLDKWGLGPGHLVLDPFAGSGTVCVVCDAKSIPSIGIDAHPLVARICRAKLLWGTPVDRFTCLAREVQCAADASQGGLTSYSELIRRSYSDEALMILDGLKGAWSARSDGSPESELVWLALTAILRPCAKAGTAQWQYILPNKEKKNVSPPRQAFARQVEMMRYDMRLLQASGRTSVGKAIAGDARQCASLVSSPVDAVITSPPYANNYDYADALRFEMTFWGEVSGWGDIHDKVRKHLLVSSSQHSSREGLDATALLASPEVAPIRDELAAVVTSLSSARQEHGGKKHYHTMVPAYFQGLALVFRELRKVCKPGATMCWVIGDSAPYGVYCPVEQWIGRLAVAEGFTAFRFEKLRDRNIKWKNRKHRVPLQEGLLWIEG